MIFLRSIIGTLFIFLSVTVGAHGGEESSYVLTNVNRIDMTLGKVVNNSNVWVKDGLIAAVDSSNIPKSVKQISLKGKWLIPGLSEMHAHVPPYKEQKDYAERVLSLFVIHGVTNIRGMLGEPSHLVLRERLNTGRHFGPYLVTSGPSFNGNTVKGVEQARNRVRQQASAGYDFLKIHPGMSKASYEAVVSQAKISKMPWGGHISALVGIVDTLEYGQFSIDHLDGFIEELVARSGGDKFASRFFGYNIGHLVEYK